jgi:para-nitrobenzyl esterase
VFKGLRYGKAPVGKLRFMRPQKPDKWTGVEDATSLGAPAIQLYTPSGPRTSDFTRQIQAIFPTAGETKIDNEDCLFLNVWTPANDTKKRPVLVWFHGGGFDYGSGGWPVYDGANLAKKGNVVVVTVNHRLNAFGYLYLAKRFGNDFAASGNDGNLDLIASLNWVRDNIAAFGGDPANVTIAGESGGGAKVSTLLATPAARGLFAKAIIQSGPGVTAGRPESAAKLTDAILDDAGVKTLDDLRAVGADDLIAATRRAIAKMGGGGFGGGPRFGPIVDGQVLLRDPFADGAPTESKDVPILVGWNKDEMTLFTAAQPWFGTLDEKGLNMLAATFGPQGKALIDAYRKERPTYSPTYLANAAMTARFVQGSYVIAAAKAAQGGAPVYVYSLRWETPGNGGVFKAPHTLDLPLMFNNVDRSRMFVGPGKAPETMAAMMSDAWLAFMRTGTPASKLLPVWKPYSASARNVMFLDLKPTLMVDPDKTMLAVLGGG